MGELDPREAALVLPRWDRGGHRRANVDEDAFTLAVAAAELLDAGRAARAVQRVRLFGAFPAEAVATVGVAVGAPPAEVTVQADDATEIVPRLEGAAPDGAELWLFGDAIARDVPQGPDRDSVGLAVRVVPASTGRGDSAPAPRRMESAFHVGATGSALATAWERLGRTAARVEHPPPLTPPPAAPPDASPPLDLRSEGAYVPWPRYLENLPSRWRFTADRCGACGQVTFPQRGFCRSCSEADQRTPLELPRRGLLVEAVTTVHAGSQPSEFDWWIDRVGAYDVALLELASGARVTLQATDAAPGAYRAGDRVDTALRRLYPMEGRWRYGRKVVPGSPTPAASG